MVGVYMLSIPFQNFIIMLLLSIMEITMVEVYIEMMMVALKYSIVQFMEMNQVGEAV